MPYARIPSSMDSMATVASSTTNSKSVTYPAAGIYFVKTSRQGATTETVTDNGGNTWTAFGTPSSFAGHTDTVYYANITTPGTFTLTQTLAAAQAFSAFYLFGLSGVTGTPVQVSNGQLGTEGTGTDGCTSGNLTPGANAAGALIGLLQGYNNGSPTIVAGTSFGNLAEFTAADGTLGTYTWLEDRRILNNTPVPATFTTNAGTDNVLTFAIWIAESIPGPSLMGHGIFVNA